MQIWNTLLWSDHIGSLLFPINVIDGKKVKKKKPEKDKEEPENEKEKEPKKKVKSAPKKKKGTSSMKTCETVDEIHFGS